MTSFLIVADQKTLKLSKYHEKVSISIPQIESYDPKTRVKKIKKNFEIDLKSHPICCVADIPIMHLNYLKPRYGKFALGFYRDSLIKEGFNPVLYTLYDTNVIRAIYEGLSRLELIDIDNIEEAISSIWDIVDNINDKDVKDEIEYMTAGIEIESDLIYNRK